MNNFDEEKKAALETLEKVKAIYDNEGGEILCGGFWIEFMDVVDAQIAEVKEMGQKYKH